MNTVSFIIYLFLAVENSTWKATGRNRASARYNLRVGAGVRCTAVWRGTWDWEQGENRAHRVFRNRFQFYFSFSQSSLQHCSTYVKLSARPHLTPRSPIAALCSPSLPTCTDTTALILLSNSPPAHYQQHLVQWCNCWLLALSSLIFAPLLPLHALHWAAVRGCVHTAFSMMHLWSHWSARRYCKANNMQDESSARGI